MTPTITPDRCDNAEADRLFSEMAAELGARHGLWSPFGTEPRVYEIRTC